MSERDLSNAYLRLRALIPGAYDTPHAPTPEQVWETTEAALRRALQERDGARIRERAREEGRREELERCARHVGALAIAIRDNGPTSPEGLLTALAGAQVGALLDAAASLRATAGSES